jgi:hypothetical protein
MRKRLMHENNQFLGDLHEKHRMKRDNPVREEFAEPKDNIPSLSAESDYKYKKML